MRPPPAVNHAVILLWSRVRFPQVTVEYKKEGGAVVPVRVHTILISTQHSPDVSNETIHKELMEHVIKPVVPEKYLDEKTIFHLNPSGMSSQGLPMDWGRLQPNSLPLTVEFGCAFGTRFCNADGCCGRCIFIATGRVVVLNGWADALHVSQTAHTRAVVIVCM